jgi:hypothetical protein
MTPDSVALAVRTQSTLITIRPENLKPVSCFPQNCIPRALDDLLPEVYLLFGTFSVYCAVHLKIELGFKYATTPLSLADALSKR